MNNLPSLRNRFSDELLQEALTNLKNKKGQTADEKEPPSLLETYMNTEGLTSHHIAVMMVDLLLGGIDTVGK